MGSKLFPSKNRKTTILNSQSIRMLQAHMKNDIYNKYCLIYNNLLTPLHPERPKFHRVSAVLSAIGLNTFFWLRIKFPTQTDCFSCLLWSCMRTSQDWIPILAQHIFSDKYSKC